MVSKSTALSMNYWKVIRGHCTFYIFYISLGNFTNRSNHIFVFFFKYYNVIFHDFYLKCSSVCIKIDNILCSLTILHSVQLKNKLSFLHVQLYDVLGTIFVHATAQALIHMGWIKKWIVKKLTKIGTEHMIFIWVIKFMWVISSICNWLILELELHLYL